MAIIFDQKAREGLKALIDASTENYVRIKPFYGCGKPAFEIYADYKKDTDIGINISGIDFVFDKDDEKACSDIEIKYDKDIYNNAFYIKSK